MSSQSSRGARSARRGALKTRATVVAGGVSKLASRSKSTKSSKVISKPKACAGERLGKSPQRNAVRAQTKTAKTAEQNAKPVGTATNSVQSVAPLNPTELPAKETSAELAEAAAEVSIPAMRTSTPQPEQPAEHTTSYEPMTPTSPRENAVSFAPKLALAESFMTDDELQSYLREFEAVSNGGDVPEPEVADVSDMPLSPSLDAAAEAPTRPTSPLALNSSEEAEPAKETQGEVKFDDYLNYTNDAASETDSVNVDSDLMKPRKQVPFGIYRNRADLHLVSSSFNPNKRTLIAAWQTMAPDVQYSTREAYFQSVLLAAASLNQRSLLSGRARETMAPALGTSH